VEVVVASDLNETIKGKKMTSIEGVGEKDPTLTETKEVEGETDQVFIVLSRTTMTDI
jgi:hypothetical protein